VDIRKLYAKANDNSQDQCHYKILEDAYVYHGTIRAVKDENDKNVYQSDGAACNQWNVQKQIEGDCRSNYLNALALMIPCSSWSSGITSAISVAIMADSEKM
jgi:hypothetical protein